MTLSLKSHVDLPNGVIVDFDAAKIADLRAAGAVRCRSNQFRTDTENGALDADLASFADALSARGVSDALWSVSAMKTTSWLIGELALETAALTFAQLLITIWRTKPRTDAQLGETVRRLITDELTKEQGEVPSTRMVSAIAKSFSDFKRASDGRDVKTKYAYTAVALAWDLPVPSEQEVAPTIPIGETPLPYWAATVAHTLNIEGDHHAIGTVVANRKHLTEAYSRGDDLGNVTISLKYGF